MPPVVAAVVVVANAVGLVSAASAIAFLSSTWFAVTSWALMIGGSIGYSRAQQKKMKRKAAEAAEAAALRRMNVRVAADSGKLILGEVRMGGTIFFVEQTGTNKEYTHVAIAHACHECDSFQKHYLNDEEVTLDGSGNVTSGKFAGLITIKNYLGTDGQTVSTDLQTEVGSSVWTNDHRVRGWCWTYMKCHTPYDVFQGGLPTYSADIRGAKAYDPRTATTAWTQNVALLVRWYLELGRTRGGVGATSSELPDAYFNAAANICDESVSLSGGGTESRYTCNGVIDTAAAPGENLAALLAAMAGIMPYVNGQFCVRAGAHASTVIDLDENDIVGPIELQTRDSAREAFNGVKGLYVSPKNNWQPADFPPVVNATYTTEDGGERIWEDVTLAFTTSSATAQRLAKIMLERSRQDFIFTAPFKLKALNLIPGDVVTLTLSRYGFSAKEFEVVQTALRMESESDVPVLKCYLTLRETASGVWDWNSGEETAVDLAPNTTLVDRYSVPTPSTTTLSTSNFVQTDGTITPRLKVEWTAPADALILAGGYTHIEYKKSADSDWSFWGKVRGDMTFDYITDVQSGVSYDVRRRYENRHGIKGEYGTTATATVSNDASAPSTPSGLSASAGTGKAVSLDWSDNTEDDLLGYKIYRNTTNDASTATYLAFVAASAFTDSSVAESTSYYYFITAVDRTGNESSKTSGAAVTTGSVASSGIARGSGSANAGLNSGGQTTVVSVSKTAATVLVSGNVTVENQDAVADSGVTVRIYRDSTLIHTLPTFDMAAYEIDGPVAFSVTDNPGAGTYTYAVKAYRTVSGATILVSADMAVIG